jgi:hypothetical protein
MANPRPFDPGGSRGVLGGAAAAGGLCGCNAHAVTEWLSLALSAVASLAAARARSSGAAVATPVVCRCGTTCWAQSPPVLQAPAAFVNEPRAEETEPWLPPDAAVDPAASVPLAQVPAHLADELAAAPVDAAAAWEVVRRRRRSPRAPPVLLRLSIANAFGVLSGEAHDDDDEAAEGAFADGGGVLRRGWLSRRHPRACRGGAAAKGDPLGGDGGDYGGVPLSGTAARHS